MRIAVVYDEKKIYVEFGPDKFRELLKKYFAETGDIDKALDMIIADLKKAVLKK